MGQRAGRGPPERPQKPPPRPRSLPADALCSPPAPINAALQPRADATRVLKTVLSAHAVADADHGRDEYEKEPVADPKTQAEPADTLLAELVATAWRHIRYRESLGHGHRLSHAGNVYSWPVGVRGAPRAPVGPLDPVAGTRERRLQGSAINEIALQFAADSPASARHT